MNDNELYNIIRDIVYAVPDNLYKYSKPDDYWDDEEWAKMPSIEKGFILIKELIENADSLKYSEKQNQTILLNNVKVLDLGKGPTFWNQADEDMFFNAIYSLASFVEIKGEGRNLYLYYHDTLTNEEKVFLIGLLKRYQMNIPKELGN